MKTSQKQLEWNKSWRSARARAVHDALGVTCVLCDGSMMYYHEIHGKPHKRGYKYILDHLEDFTPVCVQCHRGVHWLMSVGNKSWSELYPILLNVVKISIR